jgi:hypothetical protein
VAKLWSQIAQKKYEKERAARMIYSTFLLEIVVNRYLKRFAGRTNLNKLRCAFTSACSVVAMAKTQERKCKRHLKHFLTQTAHLYALSQSFQIYKNKIDFISRRIKLRTSNRAAQMANLLDHFDEQKKIMMRNLTKTTAKKKKDKKEDEENEKLKTKVCMLDSSKMLPVLQAYLSQCV